MKILIVEDDVKLAGLLERGLTQAGHTVDFKYDGRAGQTAAAQGKYDTIILDVMLPKQDGLTVLRNLRSQGVTAAVLLLTARDATEDVVAGFECGADDYLRKPFAFDELLARIRTFGRRGQARPQALLQVDNLVLNTTTKEITRGEHRIELTARELSYLEYFMRNSGIVITRSNLESALWDGDAEISSNVVDVYVMRLRSKIEFAGMRPLLETVRGIGYRFG